MQRVNELTSARIGNTLINIQTWGSVMINVDAYNATGDGSDETAEIQAAIDAATAANMKAIFFPHGTYVASSLSNLSSVVLFGDNAKLIVSGSLVYIQQLGDYARTGINQNSIINGNFDIWQRGTSFMNPPNNTYVTDRFKVLFGAGVPDNIVHSRQQIIPGDIPSSYYFHRLSTNGAGSSPIDYRLVQVIENGTQSLCGSERKLTLSFWARSSISNKKIGVFLGQYYGASGSPLETINGTNWTLTSNWKKYTHTFSTNSLFGKTVSSDNSLILNIAYAWDSSNQLRVGASTAETFGGAGNIDIAQFQLCSGETVLPYQPRSFAEELALCQRYYEKSYNLSVNLGTNFADGYYSYRTRDSVAAMTSGFLVLFVPFKVLKRTSPTVIIYSTSTGTQNAVRVNFADDRTGVTAGGVAQNGISNLNVNNTSSTLISQDYVIDFHYTADAEL